MSLSWVDAGTSIKKVAGFYVLCALTSPLAQMIRSCKCLMVLELVCILLAMLFLILLVK